MPSVLGCWHWRATRGRESRRLGTIYVRERQHDSCWVPRIHSLLPDSQSLAINAPRVGHFASRCCSSNLVPHYVARRLRHQSHPRGTNEKARSTVPDLCLLHHRSLGSRCRSVHFQMASSARACPCATSVFRSRHSHSRCGGYWDQSPIAVVDRPLNPQLVGPLFHLRICSSRLARHHPAQPDGLAASHKSWNHVHSDALARVSCDYRGQPTYLSAPK